MDMVMKLFQQTRELMLIADSILDPSQSLLLRHLLGSY